MNVVRARSFLKSCKQSHYGDCSGMLRVWYMLVFFVLWHKKGDLAHGSRPAIIMTNALKKHVVYVCAYCKPLCGGSLF